MMKFFTKKWYPWNIIILVLSILLISILIWGGVTNWKFIPPTPPKPPTPTPPKPPIPTPPKPPTPTPPKPPTPTPPTRVRSMTLKIQPSSSNDKESEQIYGYIKDLPLGSLDPSVITLNNEEVEIKYIVFGAPKEGVSKSIKNYYLLIGFNSIQIINACISSPSWVTCTIKIIIDNNSYNFDLKNGTVEITSSDESNIVFKLPDNFPKLSGLVGEQIIVQFIQN